MRGCSSIDRKLTVYSGEKLVGYILPNDGLKNAQSSVELNGPSTLNFELPVNSEKRSLLNDIKCRVRVDGREYCLLDPSEDVRDERLVTKIQMSESWTLLGRHYKTIGNTPLAVIVLSSDSYGGYEAGSAASALYALLENTGWTLGIVDVEGKHDLETEKLTILENINEVQKLWGGWLVWDSINKILHFRDEEQWQIDNGYVIQYRKNQKQLIKITKWDSVVTKLYPLGEKDLSIASVNDGKLYLEDYSFTDDVREQIKKWPEIKEPDELKVKATEYLTKHCKPLTQYRSAIVDLRTIPEYSHETFSVGDIITIQDEDISNNVKIRIVAYVYDIVQPWKCSFTLGDPLYDPFLEDFVETSKRVEMIYGDTKFVLSNFDSKNDRNPTTPRMPTITSDGTAIDHSINTNGSCDMSFEWIFDDFGDEGKIDGFEVYVHSSVSDEPYVFDDTDAPHTVCPFHQRFTILRGLSPDLYYSFGVRAYRIVDHDIDESGIKQSAITQPSFLGENPYHPSDSVEFYGDILGSINGIPVSEVLFDIDEALADAAGAYALADGKIVTFLADDDEPPTATSVGDLWIVSDLDNILRRWTGTQWEDIRDQGISEALQTAAGAQATADGKITTFYNDIAPTEALEGDLWVDTTDGKNNLHRYDGTIWVDIRDKAARNFDSRNDRIATTPANPVVSSNGSAIEHTIGPGAGMADISFEWIYSGSGDAYDVDGFIVYVRASESSSSYTFGTNPKEEEEHMLPKDKTFYIMRGVDPTLYYSFGVQAYRIVDYDVDSTGIKQSNIVQPPLSSENPYHPESNTAWPGDVTGTVGGTPVDRVANTIGFGDGSDGELNTTGSITYSVPLDGEPVVKRYTSITINAGHTVTVGNRCKGLIILCQGDCIINGRLRMDDKAAYIGSGIPGGTSANFAMMAPITSTFAYMLIPVGGAGGDGGNGGSGVIRVVTSTGWSAESIDGGIGGKGGVNSAFGGSGGGGGGGGAARYYSQTWRSGGSGGSGAPNGGDYGIAGSASVFPGDGTDGKFGGGGGILAIIAGGNIIIGSTGIVSASGTTPGSPGVSGSLFTGSIRSGGGGGGGGHGGGVVVLAHKGNYTNSGSVLVNGSAGGSGGSGGGATGLAGQVGSIMTVKL